MRSLLGFGVSLALASHVFAQTPPVAPISEQELLSRMQALADSLTGADEFSGVVLIAKDGKVIFERGYGLANRETRTPVTVHTTFNISSIGKLFTAAAIQQLAADGRIRLDAPISTYWPDYPNEAARRVTIQQLLEHRSGINGNVFQNLSTLNHNREYLQNFIDRPLEFEPGSRSAYSNAGFVVLGEIITRVSGEDFYDYMQERVFKPAGMIATSFPRLDSLPALAAIGYTRRRPEGQTGPWHSNATLQVLRGSAAGGAYASARDLFRFSQARRNGALGISAGNGLGIAGGSPGSNAEVNELLPGGYDVFVLSNMDPPSAARLSMAAARWLGVNEQRGNVRR